MAKKVGKVKTEKVKQKQYKRIESSICKNCSEQLQCKEYEKYKIKMAQHGFGIGVVCRKG